MRMLNSFVANLAIGCTLLVTSPAHAFLNELIGVGVEVGGKLLGAGIDKVKDSMKDHEAEARRKEEEKAQQVKAFNEAVSRIEERTDLSPLQKERAVRQLHKQAEFANRIAALDQQAQAHRKAQRDRLFTPEGMLDTVGNAAVNAAATRIVLAKADAMVAAGIPQAQTRSVFGQVDDASIIGAREKTQRVLALASAATAAASSMDRSSSDGEGTTHSQPPNEAGSVEPASTGAPSVVADSVVPAVPVTAFTPDRDKMLALTFSGAPKAEAELRARLTALGHQLVEDTSLADVVYRIEGEYLVPEGRQYSGTKLGFGEILDAQTIDWKPERKIAGAIGTGVAKFMLALGKAQGAQIPKELEGGNPDHLKQEVLLVISREPKVGRPTRASFSKEVLSSDVQAVAMVLDTYTEMLIQLGVKE